jgi:hypothetical protein
MMRKKIGVAALALALLLVGCSTPSGQPQAQPPAKNGQPAPGGGATDGGKSGTGGTGSDAVKEPAAEEKTEAQVQQEIREKLGRLTNPKTGYALPVDANGLVKEVATLDEIAELLRKKGYAPSLAKELTEGFYKVSGKGVMLIARDGHPGVFDTKQTAVMIKKNKWSWTVEQEHPNDQLNGPHVAVYEVEVLKDGTYRLNSWKTKAQ